MITLSNKDIYFLVQHAETHILSELDAAETKSRRESWQEDLDRLTLLKQLIEYQAQLK